MEGEFNLGSNLGRKLDKVGERSLPRMVPLSGIRYESPMLLRSGTPGILASH